MKDLVKLGEFPDASTARDAIHIAVLPAKAAMKIYSGDHVGFSDGVAGPSANPIGIVDPFLTKAVDAGGWFWLCLYPGSITSLRHDWTHPAFDEAPDKAASEAWMKELASRHSEGDDGYHGEYRMMTVEKIIEAGREFLLTGHRYVQQGSESLRDRTNPAEFWRHFEVLTGMQVPDYHKGNVPFCCTC